MNTTTKSQAVAADIAALLRARNPLLWVVSREEQRVEGYLFEAAANAGYIPRTWDVAAGVCNMNGTVQGYGKAIGDPDGALDVIKDSTERGVWIMRDLPPWLTPPVGAVTLRRLRNLARFLPGQPRDKAQAVIVLSPTADVPAELANHATVIEWPLPDRDEIAVLMDAAVESLPDEYRPAAVNGNREQVLDAAVGLSGEEVQATFAKSLVATKTIDPTVISAEKRRVVAQSGAEWFDSLPGGLEAVGGLDNLKAWLRSRAAAWSPAAREYGLPSPKGALLVGVPGCGKSMACKAVATEWGVPLLRLDLGGVKSKYVGESEGNLRKALAVVEAIGRCVVWIDEIEKALAGATGEAGDGGVSADALGTLLQWMQERQGDAFVLATANNAEKLPPELMRKGRFDEVWWVDLPTHVERAGVVAASLMSFGRGGDVGIDLDAVAAVTDTFTGAELAALVPDALFAAFAENGRQVTTEDLLAAAKTVTPLATTADAKITALREFWSGRARPASIPAAVTTIRSGARALDL